MKPSLTIFTPTYNRAYCLHKCYESMKRQKNKNFMWLIIDDGSTDNTKEVVEKWQNENSGFEIKYVFKENGGLHTGYNEAIAHSDTELMMCIDSDDYLTDNAVDIVLTMWRQNGNDKYAGIVALDVFENGEIIGDPLPNVEHINLIDLMLGKYKIKNGDRKNVVRTDLYKSVAPMPSFDNEKNFNPHYMHIQISEKYDFLVLNEPLCVVEYQPDGMTNNIFKQYYNSPKSFTQTRKQNMSLKDAPLSFVFKQCIHYVSSCKIAGYKHIISSSPKPFLTFFAYPLGVALKAYILYKVK